MENWHDQRQPPSAIRWQKKNELIKVIRVIKNYLPGLSAYEVAATKSQSQAVLLRQASLSDDRLSKGGWTTRSIASSLQRTCLNKIWLKNENVLYLLICYCCQAANSQPRYITVTDCEFESETTWIFSIDILAENWTRSLSKVPEHFRL